MAEDNQLKVLYRKMLVDEATAESTKKYSIGGFEKKLLSDKALTDKIADLAVERNWAADKDDFYTKYFSTPKAPAIAKAAPVAPFQQPVEPMAMEGIPVGIAAPKPTKAPAPSVTDYAREMAFEPQIEAPVKPIGVMAPQPIQEPIPSVTETAREMAFKPPAAPKKPKEKERGFMEWTGDVFGTISAGGERIAKNILAGIGHYAQAQAATDPMASLPYEKRQQMLQEAGQTMYDIADAAQKDFQNEVAKRNIETSVLQAIDKKQYKNIPEAVLYTVGDAAMQIIPSVLTMGGSTYLQTLPTAYKDGVEAIAKEKGISPEQVIASGEDAIVVASISSGFQSALQNVGAGQVSKAIASKGAYKAVRDWLLKQNVNKNLARGAALLGVGIGEGTTEYFQEGVGQAGVIAAKSPTAKAFFERLPKELFTAEAEKQRQESFVGGLIGGGGLAGAGRAITKAFEKPAEQPSITPEAEVAPEAPVVQTVNPEFPAPQLTPEEAVQEDENLAALNEQIAAIEGAPVEEEIVAKEAPAAPIAPLNIDFLKNEGRNVNYQGVQGRIKIDSDGVPYVFTKDGDVVYIEGGLSGQTPQQLGVQPLADDVISETDIEAVLQDEGAPLDQGQLEYDFENNSITLYGKPFTYDGVEVNSKGQTTALRLKDANGKTKYVRNEDTILEFEIQKELYEKSKSNKPLTVESAIQAAEQLQVSPVARPEQVPQPVQQERPVGDIAEYEVSPTEEAPATSGLFEGITGPPQEVPVAAEEAPVAAEEVVAEEVPAPAPKGKKGVTIEFPTKLSVGEVKPYAEVPDNYYRPDQQLKFNQGNYYEPVRVIAHPDVIRAITIGSRLGDAQKRKTVSDSDIEFANKIAKQLGYTNDAGNGNAIMLHRAVKDLAKENRSKDEEVFMVIGNEAKAPKPAPVTPPPALKAQPAKTNEEQIAILRAEEQAELDSRIKNADKYRGPDGKVDRTKLTKKADIKAFDEVYEKYNEPITRLMETKPAETTAQAEFTSKQESSASEEFDGTKKPSKIKMKSFDGKHGKGAFERMKNITDNFEDIMNGLAEKIKQDCL